jgi:hypothetical protein
VREENASLRESLQFNRDQLHAADEQARATVADHEQVCLRASALNTKG